MKSNLPDGPDHMPDGPDADLREIDCDLMFEGVLRSLPRRLRGKNTPRAIRVDPDDCSVSLRRTRRSRRSFTVTVDSVRDSDCGDPECLGCRTKLLCLVLGRVLEEGVK